MQIGLDVAKKMGVAVLVGSEIHTTVIEGTPQEQMFGLVSFLGDLTGSIVYIEKLNSFVNANTTRSLLLRTGFIAGTLEQWLCDIDYIIATQARKFQGVKSKVEAQALFTGLTPDEADAVVILLFGLKKKSSDFNVLSKRNG